MVRTGGKRTMGQVENWVPGGAPPDEGYWEALLRDEENGQATSLAILAEPGSKEGSEEIGVLELDERATGGDQWSCAREAMEQGKVIELPVVGCNRGGVLVGWDGLRGFVPASHLTNLSPLSDEGERYDELRCLIGSRLRLKVIELEPERGRFVLSERTSHLDKLCPHTLDEVPTLGRLGGSDELKLRLRENALESHDDEVVNEIDPGVLRAAPHVLLLELDQSLGDRRPDQTFILFAHVRFHSRAT